MGGGLLTIKGAQTKGSAKASYGPWVGREGEVEGLGVGSGRAGSGKALGMESGESIFKAFLSSP